MHATAKNIITTKNNTATDINDGIEKNNEV